MCADAIDWLSEQIGQALKWLVLFRDLISAGNALIRYRCITSSNAWLEIQWYMFAAMFLLAAGYALKYDEHVRVDVCSARCRRSTAGLGRRGRRHPLPDADGLAHRMAVDPDGA